VAGHSKWANIRHRKAREDAKKGKLFSKLSREIIVAARQGGGDPESNFRLKAAIQKAKDADLPMDNIKRAIQRGTGAVEGADYEELVYEGYGPGGVALLVELLTDNRNRTAAEIRHLFARNGGSLGESGCVAWMFDKKGLIVINPSDREVDEEELFLQALEAGAEDFQSEDGTFEIFTSPENLEAVRTALEEKNYPVQLAEITMVPKNTVSVRGKEAEQTLRLVEALEDHDDVQNVYSNFDIPKEEMEKYAAG